MDSYSSFENVLAYRRLLYGTFILDDGTLTEEELRSILDVPDPNTYHFVVGGKPYFFTSQQIDLYNLQSRDDITYVFQKLKTPKSLVLDAPQGQNYNSFDDALVTLDVNSGCFLQRRLSTGKYISAEELHGLI